jgi:hypothetical protein
LHEGIGNDFGNFLGIAQFRKVDDQSFHGLCSSLLVDYGE